MYKKDNPQTWHGLIEIQRAHIAALNTTIPAGQNNHPELLNAQSDLNRLIAAERLEPSWERVPSEDKAVHAPSSYLPFSLKERDDCIISPDVIVYKADELNNTVETRLLMEAMKYVADSWRGNQIRIYGGERFRKLSWAVAQVHDVEVANFRLLNQDKTPRVTQLKIAHGIITGPPDTLKTFDPSARITPQRPGSDVLSDVLTKFYRL
ncbi:MAG: hypothetical protein WBK91_09390 [Alphaproteobacteria bacterium]